METNNNNTTNNTNPVDNNQPSAHEVTAKQLKRQRIRQLLVSLIGVADPRLGHRQDSMYVHGLQEQ